MPSGQVSHIPTAPLSRPLRQVLCYERLSDAANPHNQRHCIGASGYHQGDESTVWREEDQRQNRQRLLDLSGCEMGLG